MFHKTTHANFKFFGNIHTDNLDFNSGLIEIHILQPNYL